MCVISFNKGKRLTEEQVDQMYDANPRGGGIAWRDLVDGTPVVKWRKGLTRPEMQEANKTLPFPYILHFRVPSHGTSNSWLACHPFAIDEHASYDFEGEIKGYVLFHNGLWVEWKRKMETLALSGCCFIPSGPWSDSRGLAWAAHHLGIGYLEITEEKIIALGPLEEDIEIFGGWFELEKDDDGKALILVSNKTWEKYVPPVHVRTPSNNNPLPMLADKNKDEKAGGTSHDGTFRNSSGRATDAFRQATDNKNAVQEEAEKANRLRLEAGREIQERGTVGALEDDKCCVCWKRTRSGTYSQEKWYCWQCWSDKKLERNTWLGRCSKCNVNKAASKIRANGNWICTDCWSVNGRPDIYFGRPGMEVVV